MTKRDDVVVPSPAEGEAVTPTAEASARLSGGASPASGRRTRGGKKQAETPPAAETESDPSSSDDAGPQHDDSATATRSGVFGSVATEWASLADPNAAAPGGAYSTGVS